MCKFRNDDMYGHGDMYIPSLRNFQTKIDF